MVNRLNQIVELNNYDYLLEIGIKEGIFEQPPITFKQTKE